LKKWSRSPTKGNTIGCTSRERNPLGSATSARAIPKNVIAIVADEIALVCSGIL